MSDRNNRIIRPNGARRRFIAGLGGLGAAAMLTGCDRWTTSPAAQRVVASTQDLTRAAQELIASRESLAREFKPSQIAPTFRANGTTSPQNPDYQRMARNRFADWRLQVAGLVQQPAQFSLEQLKSLPSQTQITRHDCVEGWSCIGQWTGVRLSHVLAMVQPKDSARFVVFHCADKPYGAPTAYYESLDMIEAHHPQTLLAYGLNGQPLPVANGAPIRLRAERQLGYKQAKYVMGLELVDSFNSIQGGKGGWWEDRGYQWWAGI